MTSRTHLMLATLLLALAAALPAAAADTEPRMATKAQPTQEKEGVRHEPAEGTQQHKRKVCNVEAHEKGLHGDERRAFMSSCLRKQ